VRRVVATALVACALVACAGEPSDGPKPEGCGFPTPGRDLDEGLIPEPFLMEGAEIFRMQTRQGRRVVGLEVPHDVDEAFDHYRRAAKQVGYDVLQLDNEGFEAEIYLKAGKGLAAITIRSSACEGTVAVYLNLPDDG
jgi:hypothetical protein